MLGDSSNLKEIKLI